MYTGCAAMHTYLNTLGFWEVRISEVWLKREMKNDTHTHTHINQHNDMT